MDSMELKKDELGDTENSIATHDTILDPWEERKERETEEYKRFFAMDNGFYHKLYDDIDTTLPISEQKKIKNILININIHGDVSQTIYTELGLLNDSSDIEIEESEEPEEGVINTTIKQDKIPVSTIVTEICTSDIPITLINFPCALDTPVTRLDYSRSEIIGYPIQQLGYNSCANSQYLNRLLSNSTSENLNEILSLVVDETNVQFQQRESSVNSGVGQISIKRGLQKLLNKHFEVYSRDNYCNTIDLYIYDMLGTHKYTILAPPPSNMFIGGRENDAVEKSFRELQKYYDDHENIKNIFKELRESVTVIYNRKIKCITGTRQLVSFINKLKLINCDMAAYIIDGSCFNARTVNYKSEDLTQEQQQQVNAMLLAASHRQLYGGKYKTKRSKTKRSKTKRSKTKRSKSKRSKSKRSKSKRSKTKRSKSKRY